MVNDFSPRHFVIALEERDKYPLGGNFVQIKVADIGATDMVAVRRELQESNQFASLEIKQQKKMTEEHVIHDAKAILYQGDEMLTRYARQVGHDGLDFDKLLAVGKKICEKVES